MAACSSVSSRGELARTTVRIMPASSLLVCGKSLRRFQGPSFSFNRTRIFAWGGRASKGLYQYALTDQNIDELNSWAPKLVTKLRDYPQIKDPTSDQQFRGLQETVVIDRD